MTLTKNRALVLSNVAAIPGAEQFVASEHFRKANPFGVQFWQPPFNSDVGESFLDKKETDIADTKLDGYLVRSRAHQKGIIAEIGDPYEAQLHHVWQLLLGQPNGEPGILGTNGMRNIFFVRNSKNVLGVVTIVHIGGNNGNWNVYGEEFPGPFKEHVGGKVFRCR